MKWDVNDNISMSIEFDKDGISFNPMLDIVEEKNTSCLIYKILILKVVLLEPA